MNFKALILFIFSLFLFPSTSIAGVNFMVQITNPTSGSTISSPVSIDGRSFIGGIGPWNCGFEFAVVQYRFDNSNLFNGNLVHVARLPFDTWNDFSQSSGGLNSPVESLSPGNHTLYWRVVSGAAPLMSAGPICIGPTNSINFRVVNPAFTPTISFLLNESPQNISLNTPQDTFSYTVSASSNAERCYRYNENIFGGSGSWAQTSCNQNFSNISLENLASGLSTFLLGYPQEGENRYFVRAWNSTGGYSPTVERRINVAAGLPQVTLWNDPPINGWEEMTNVYWNVDNADSCTTSSSPSQLWWNGVSVPIFAGSSNNSFSPVSTPPVTETYELIMTCSNSIGSATARLNIAPQNPGYCGDGYRYNLGFNPEECDAGMLNGTPGSDCDNMCRRLAGLDFILTTDQLTVNYPNSVTIRSRLINSGIPGVNSLSCIAVNSPENMPFWSGGVPINTTSDLVRSQRLNPGTHTVSLECDNGFDTVTKNVQVQVIANENGQCGTDSFRSLTSTPTNLCSAGIPNPSVPVFNNMTQRWNWQCRPTGSAIFTDNCYAEMAQAPQIWTVDIRNESNTLVVSEISADGNAEYNVNVYGNENSGGNNISSLYAAVNYDGTIHAPAYRGFLGWSNENFPGWGGSFSEGPVACTGGGFGAIRSSYGSEFINLISCSINTSGNSRTAIFRVSFNSNFVSPVSNNVLSAYVRNNIGMESSWVPGGSFNLRGSSPTVNGQCGSADGKKRFTKPAGSVLCNAGNPTTVSGSGPWAWTCRGTGPGSSDSRICRADKWRIGFEEN